MDPRHPAVAGRLALLLLSGLVAVALAPAAAGDPTTTDPAPDPNPPAGAAPDPYKAPPAQPKPTPVVHSTPRVYSSPRTYSPPPTVRPAATTPVAHPARTTRHVAKKHRKHVVHHRHRSVAPVRITPKASAYVAALVKTAAVRVVPADEGTTDGRRRAAGLALTVLVMASLSLLLLTRRAVRVRSQS